MALNKRSLFTLDVADYVASLKSGICTTQKHGFCERFAQKKSRYFVSAFENEVNKGLSLYNNFLQIYFLVMLNSYYI
jgi:hypothetical protein